METVYLEGFHGVGKSMLGKVLASRKNLAYLDIDSAIVEKENRDIKTIVQESGVEYYRNLEKYILKNSITQGMIVSTGAGIVLDEENRHLIKKSGRVVYLRAKASTIYSNIENYHNDIAIFSNNFTVLQVEKYLDMYTSYYEELQNYAIDVDDKSIEELIPEVIAIYNFINKPKAHIYI